MLRAWRGAVAAARFDARRLTRAAWAAWCATLTGTRAVQLAEIAVRRVEGARLGLILREWRDVAAQPAGLASRAAAFADAAALKTLAAVLRCWREEAREGTAAAAAWVRAQSLAARASDDEAVVQREMPQLAAVGA